MSGMRKLWIVTELFYPDETSTSYILSKIANRLTDKYDVNVITGSALYQKNKAVDSTDFQLDNRINLIRVDIRETDKNNLLKRTLKLISSSVNLTFTLWRNAARTDKVLIVTNPAPLLILTGLLKRLIKFELTILVHDVFPENTIPAKVIQSKSSMIYRLLLPVFNRAYASADSLIVLGRDMENVVHNKLKHSKKTPAVVIVENWADTGSIMSAPQENSLIQKRHSESKITIQYAGNIGRAQGLSSFLEILNEASNKNICLDFWGDGAVKDELSEFADAHKLNGRVTFNGVYSRAEQNDILNSTDISLVTLSDGMYGLGVPSKTYNIMASGKPILFIGELNTEIALMIQEEKIGFCFDPNNKQSLTDFLNNFTTTDFEKLKVMGNKAREIAETKFSEKIIMDKYLSII
jgi:glycosyltransferase involved in cell wall biosynthesis